MQKKHNKSAVETIGQVQKFIVCKRADAWSIIKIVSIHIILYGVALDLHHGCCPIANIDLVLRSETFLKRKIKVYIYIS